MRALLYQAITASTDLTAIIPAERWIQAGAIDAPTARPFAVIRIVDGPPSISKATQPRVEIWVHDDRGSYLRIDEVLDLLEDILPIVPPLENDSDRIVAVDWSGRSPDLVDEGFNTNTRHTDFIVTGRK
jgi:hypothetical protein